MKRILFIVLVATATILKAQVQNPINPEIIEDNRSFTEIIDNALRNINYDTISTGILYDRVAPFANLEKRNGYDNDTVNSDIFIQAYSELKRASNPDLNIFKKNYQ